MNKRRGKQATASPGIQRNSPCAMEALEPRRLLSSVSTATPSISDSTPTRGIQGYFPSQVLHAYGFDLAASSIGAGTGTGAGQTVAIVEAYQSVTIAADLQKFDSQFQLPDPPSFSQVNQTGGSALPGKNSVWSQETALDVEWAHAVAPDANIVVVEAKSDGIPDLLQAVDTARHIDGVSVVSMSWGLDEFPGETDYDDLFTTPAGHASVTFVAASGDTATASGVQWPAASPNVLSVGGTTLVLDDAAADASSESSYAGATSGASQFESPPGYQSGGAATRTTPDVVYNANPVPGFAVYNTASGGWETVGGTSAGAPQWAALLAIANEARANQGQNSLDGATQTLPQLYQFYNSSQQSSENSASTPAAAPTDKTRSQSTLYYNAGSLTTSTGKPQANAVIAVLTNSSSAQVANTGSAKPQAHKAKLPHKAVHLFVLSPIIRTSLSGAVLRHGAASHGDARAVLSRFASLTAPTNTFQTLESSSTSVATSSAMGTFLASQAFSEMGAVTFSRFDPITQMMATLYGEISIPGGHDVVSVGIRFPTLADEPRMTWYIAHLDIGGTFGDAIAAFISECAARPNGNAMLADMPASGHVRAWVVTTGVIAFDLLVIGYLASRRHRRLASRGYVKWWEQPGRDLTGL